MRLLERDDLLAKLHAQVRAAAAGPGQLVFVEGEAGIGKTTLLRAFAAALADAMPLRWGACEAMLTPEPLAALHDIAQQAPDSRLAQLLRAGAERRHLFVAFVDLLAEQPSVVVVEDVHWADEATLDLLRYAGRRIGRTRSLLVASLRSDEVGPAHPLRAVLGDLATSKPARLSLPPLSLPAVRDLCGEAAAAVDADQLHRETGGNPFFVTEVLAAGPAGGLPNSVQDAVLARAGRLSPSARAVLDAAAVAGPRIEPWLLQALTAAESGAVDECLAIGVLRADGAAWAFRHELARQAVLKALTPTQRASLHRMTLHALASDAATCSAAARLAEHADGAGDAAAVRRWAVAAAHAAAARGAHRQAAAQWARALRHIDDAAERAAALDTQAVALHISVGIEPAVAARREAARLWHGLGDNDRAAGSLAEAAMMDALRGRIDEARAALAQARVLVAAGPAAAQARVQACAACLALHDGNVELAAAITGEALDGAEPHGDIATQTLNLKSRGMALLHLGRVDEGVARLETSLALAAERHDDKGAGQAFSSIAAGCLAARRFDLAERYLQRGIGFCAERDVDAPRLHLVTTLAHLRLLQGRWDDAAVAAGEVLADARATTIARLSALLALGRLRARRGDPGVWALLDEASDRACSAGTGLRLSCARARAEAAWLEGRAADAAREAGQALPQAIERRLAISAELVLWCRRGGGSDGDAPAMPDFCAAEPAALEAAGRWREAAAAWQAAGCPFEAARALAEGDEAAQRQALAAFETLGARTMVERVRRRLRSGGVRDLPRLPRASTKGHPAGLTNAEIGVLALLAGGLRSKDIAARMHRSPRTVEHHLQAIFAKLGVATRAEAVGAALRLGLGDAARNPPAAAKAAP